MEERVPQKIITPKWLTQSYVRGILRKQLENENLDVLELKIDPANCIGDNYVSQMIRVSAIVKKGNNKSNNETVKLIVKTVPYGDFMQEIKDTQMFPKEALMFMQVLPIIDSILEKGFPGYPLLHAKGYEYQSQLDEVIVLEDLRESGFQLADRRKGLDMQHIRLVVESLARYHAASLILIKKKPEVPKWFDTPVWCWKNEALVANRFIGTINGHIKTVSTWPDGPVKEKCLASLKKVEKDFMARSFETYVRDENAFNVLLHGDCWMNNLMFKYEKSKPVDMKFVDFQMSVYNTPVLDLVYFLFSSAENGIRFGDIEQVLRIYHAALMEAVKKLEIVLEKPFTYQDLKREFERRSYFGVTAFLYIFPLIVCPSSKAPQTDDLFTTNAFDEMYNNDRINEAMPLAIDYFEKHGVI